MADQRWRVVTDAIQRVDPELAPGERLCLAGEDFLSVDSMSIATVIDEMYRPLASSTPWGALLDEAQFSVGDGPTFRAHGGAIPVLAADLLGKVGAAEWPLFVGAAEREGVAAAFAFPLRIGAGTLGVLTGYRAAPGGLGDQEFEDGLILASLAGAEVVRTLALDATVVAEGPDLVSYDHSTVHFATGMVAEQLNIGVVEALVRMRAYAFASGLSLTDVARLIADRQVTLEP